MGRRDPKRPKDYPILEDYEPTRFMAEGSHYDEALADFAVSFIELLPHTQGVWDGKRFWLLPWQERIIRDIFGTVKADGTRQFRTAYIEIPKKNGKSELAAAIALYLLYADGENSPIVFSAAADREQAGIVYKVAARMVDLTPDLANRSRVMDSLKRIVCYANNGYYSVASSDVGGKHGYSISGLVFDELHTQPNRELWDVLTKGSGDARSQPLQVAITTAGNNRESICYELHTKAMDLLNGKRKDPSFYPVVYSLSTEEDWSKEENWYKCNPSLGYTIKIDAMRTAFTQAQENPAEEAVFRTLRLCQWVGSSVAWIPDHILKLGESPFDPEALRGRECYGGLDLSSSDDISAFVLIFPPADEEGKYMILPFFWVPEDTVPLRVRRTSFPYDNWIGRGFMDTTPGNIIDYSYIEAKILQCCRDYQVKEIAFDPWHAKQLTASLMDEGIEMVEARQGWQTMSPPSKEFYELMMKGKITFGGNPVFRWMCQNVVIETDAAGNIKPNKKKSKEKIDGVVAAIMALDRAVRREAHSSIYDERDLIVLW